MPMLIVHTSLSENAPHTPRNPIQINVIGFEDGLRPGFLRRLCHVFDGVEHTSV